MTRPDRPYSPQTLAERWGCAEGTVRKAIARGELSTFRIGTLIRISAAEVERFECQNTPCNDSEADLHSFGARMESADAGRSTPQIDRARKPKHAAFGKLATVHRGAWGD